MFVDVELLTLRADHSGLLGAGDGRTRARLRAPFDAVGNDVGRVAVVGAKLGVGAFFSLAGVLLAVMLHPYRAPAMVPLVAGMADEVKGHTGYQPRVITFHHGQLSVATQASQAVAGEGAAGGVLLVTARIVVTLVVQVLVPDAFAELGMLLLIARVLEGVVALGLAGRAHVFTIGEAAQAGSSWSPPGIGL
ncbi:hypothetical protein CR64_03065 [Pseudomonas aeruginosa]|nr:hypothetical protein CR64_03065 [Pseudomonas aeruginosa]